VARRTLTRRGFLAGSAAAAGTTVVTSALSAGKVLGANERLSLGIVGPGSRGNHLMKWAQRFAKSHNLEFTAVCDIWNQRREAAAARVKAWTGREPRKCRTLAEICDLKDVDVLLIATADFQHAPHLAYAVRAGKDVYVEKPLGCDFEQIKKAWQAVKQTGRIVQMGTQRRGDGKYYGARDFIKSGALGKITYAEIYEPLFQQRWRIPGSETSLTEKDTNWKEFLCYCPYEPFNARHYREFRLFWPYSSGCFCQWMSHKIDLVNLALDELPRSAVAHGGVYLWKDGRTNPDTVQCLLEYPSGCLVTYHMRLGNSMNKRGTTLYGTRGTMELEAGIAYGDGGRGAVICKDPDAPNPSFTVDRSAVLKARKEGGVRWESPPSVDHMADFLEAVRTRRRTRADIDAGFAHALATTMANMAYRWGCRVEYDPKKMELKRASLRPSSAALASIGSVAGNRMSVRHMRAQRASRG